TAGVLTIVLSVGLELLFPSLPFFNRTGIVFWACMMACVGVSLVTRPKPEDALRGLIWTRESLQLPANQRERARGWRSPALWWAVITIVVLSIYVRYA
ncbi:MAG: hypothetical protein JNN01_06930, partial [Opitutaceae bacterium]|nr:hypothetical protein [Opitutaceae bacterium]